MAFRVPWLQAADGAADAAMLAAPVTYFREKSMGARSAPKNAFAHGALSLLTVVVVVSLVACVNLTPPWNAAGQDGAMSPADDAGGSSGFPDGATGGAPGSGGAAPSSFDAGALDSRGSSQDLPANKGETGSSGGAGGTAGEPDVGINDAAGGSAGDAPSVTDGSDASPRADAVQLADLADAGAPDLREDLGSDVRSDAADSSPPVCNSAYFDAKALQHTTGQAESDGWYLVGSGQFMYSNNVTYVATRTKMTVVARGDLVSNQWPTMEVSAGQTNIVGTASVTSTSMTAYSFTFDALATYSGIGVTVVSGAGLHVQSIALSCP
jgi:hypothetical protein